jgi:TIR domain
MASPHPETIQVFISYSHESRAHMDRVLALSNRLRADGIDCHIDQYEPSPPEGWPRWMMKHVAKAAFVLVVCTEIYTRRFNDLEEVGKGLGVKWEGAILTQALYEVEAHNTKFIPVVFSPHDAAYIPIVLRGVNSYDVNTEEGYEALYRRLTHQPRILRPALGMVRPMPPLERTEEFLTTPAANSRTPTSTVAVAPASDESPEMSPAFGITLTPTVHRLRRIRVSWLLGVLLVGGATWIATLAPKVVPAGPYSILGLSLALLASLFVFFLTHELGTKAHSRKSSLRTISAQAIGSLAMFIVVLAWWWSPLAPISIETNTTEKAAPKSDPDLLPAVKPGMIRFSQYQEGRFLNGTEFTGQNIQYIQSTPSGHECQNARVAILPPGSYRSQSSFLTTAAPDNLKRCNTVPVSIYFINPVRAIILHFGGAHVPYELRAYDKHGSVIDSKTEKAASYVYADYEISLAVDTANIVRVEFGYETALTMIRDIEFQQ